MSDAVIKFHIEASGEDTDSAMKVLSEANVTGAESVQPHGLAATSIFIMGAAALALLVNAAIRLVRLWSKGVVIDARGETIIVTKDPTLPRGTLLVISKDEEKAEFDKIDDLDVTKIISSLSG
ncbi:hypothetical protein [uncultured Roseobacter sp.]|uniref:hypothetical protein n=1 Tax=uncultured Roseobacter sp. TaxID=114847 RepID=UPI0026072F0E|nr:hypothetical protein [uncultured Roseobacter sp.]